MISVIVLAHNHTELTRRCIEAISHSQNLECCELLCVDNGSSEPLQALASGIGRHVSFRLLRNEDNLSFSRANNQAAKVAGGDLLVFLNNDVVLTCDALSHLVRTLAADRAAGVAGGKLLYPDGNTIQHAGMAQMLWGYASNYGVGAPADLPALNSGREMFGVTGALLAIDRSLFDSVGGFEEGYRWGYEDLDLCLKVRQKGRKVLYVPEAVGYHAESMTLRENRDWKAVETNYRLFRHRWDCELAAKEQAYLDRIRSQGIQCLSIVGTGQAASGLFNILTRNRFSVAAFSSSKADVVGSQFHGLPVLPLEAMRHEKFDRLMVASQYFFQIQSSLVPIDPLGAPLFPVLW